MNKFGRRVAALGLATALLFTSFSDGPVSVKVNANTVENAQLSASGTKSVILDTVKTDSGSDSANTNQNEDISRIEFEDEASEYGLIATKGDVKPKSGSNKKAEDDARKIAKAATPSSYMNSLSQVTAKFPSTRDQNPYGTCWAFSSTAMAEFSMISKGYKTKSVDYSELQLAYFTYHTAVDPLGGTAGDITKTNSSEGFLDMGGNRWASSRTLATWKGSVDESDVPYEDAYSSMTIDYEYAYSHDVAKLQNAYYYNIDVTDSENTMDAAKQAIMEQGAIGIDYNASSSSYVKNNVSYNDEYVSTYYYPYDSGSNHAVTVVGWDDNFPKSNFSYTPAGNGAWLVRNSWQTTAANSYNSYFWMSYYDKSLSSTAWSFEMMPADTYEYNYQYDGGYFAMSLGTSSIGGSAAVFTAQSDISVEAVMVSMWEASFVDYRIDVYKDLSDSSDPKSGTLASSQTGTTSYSGQFTIPLTTPVDVKNGDVYSVVLTCSGSQNSYDVEENYTTSDSWYNDATDSGNTWLYSKYDDEWIHPSDFAGDAGDVCIKALANDASGYRINYELDGGVNNPQNPARFTEESEDIILLDPSKTGFDFAGWYTDSDFATPITKIPTGTTEDVTVYAKWTEHSYTVRFDANGGTGDIDEITVRYTEKFTIPECTFTNGEMNFDCWTTEADGSGTKWAENVEVSKLSDVDNDVVTLYAQWWDGNLAPTTIKSITNTYTGALIKWNKVDVADSYIVYRQKGEDSWVKVKETTSKSYIDTKCKSNGTTFRYKVVVVRGVHESEASEVATNVYVSKVTVKGTNSAKKTAKFTWGKNSKATGYVLEYSTSKKFSSSVKKKTITNYKTVSATVKKLSKGKTYYVRIRAYKTKDSVKYYSAYSQVSKVKISK